MLKAGIVMDTWKLEIFMKHLKAAGFSYERMPDFSPKIAQLRVMTNSYEELAPIVKAANTEASELKTIVGI